MDIIIIDDDKTDAAALANKLGIYDGCNVAAMAHNGKDGLRLLAELEPDMAFVDIEMPDMSGLDFLEQMDYMSGGKCMAVMYTAHPQYMLNAFRNRAYDYLLKPIDDSELAKIIKRACMERMTSNRHMTMHTGACRPDNNTETDEGWNDGITRRNDGKCIVYTNAVDFKLVDIRDIGLFTYNNTLRLWEMTLTGEKEVIRLKRNINSGMILALNDTLVRVSQKHIINIAYLMEVADNTCHFYPPFDYLEDVKVGRFFRKKLIDKFSTL